MKLIVRKVVHGFGVACETSGRGSANVDDVILPYLDRFLIM